MNKNQIKSRLNRRANSASSIQQITPQLICKMIYKTRDDHSLGNQAGPKWARSEFFGLTLFRYLTGPRATSD